MTPRKIDKMRDKTFDLLLLSSTCNKLRNTESSCKAMPFYKIWNKYKEATCILIKIFMESSFKGIYAAI